MTAARKLKLVARRKREAMARHDRFAGARARSQAMLDKAGHWSIAVRTVRATIGEVFNHARQSEALLTHRYREPVIVPVEDLEDFLKNGRIAGKQSELLFQEIKLMARHYALGKGAFNGRKRAPVRHRVWKEKA